MDRLTIFSKGLLLIAVPLCFQLVFIGLVATMRRNNIDAAQWAIRSNEIIAQAESCGYRILSAHGAVQGFIITKDASFGHELRRLSADSRDKLRTLLELVSDEPEQLATARKVEVRATALLDFMEEGAAMVEGSGMLPELAASRRRQAQKLLEVLSGEMSRFIANERTQNLDRRLRLEMAWKRLDGLLLGGLLLSILKQSADRLLVFAKHQWSNRDPGKQLAPAG